MTPSLHRQFVETAGDISQPLENAIRRIGRLAISRRDRQGLPAFLARVVVGQQLSTSVARVIWARVEAVARERGESMPEFFCARNARVLRRCGMSKAKIRALIAIREAHASGRLSVARLRRMEHAQRCEHLCRIHGIGQWTADMTSIFYFGDPDVWPEGDAGVRRGLATITGRRSTKALLRIANAFAPHRSFLALYMWRILDEPQAARTRTPSAQPL